MLHLSLQESFSEHCMPSVPTLAIPLLHNYNYNHMNSALIQTENSLIK